MLVVSWRPVEAESLPFDRTNPFIWDNDAEHDAFTLPFVLALANNGDLNVIGISQSPHPFKTSSEDFQEVVATARSAGWKNIPDATWDLGPYFMTALTAPGSGRVDDTEPLDTAPARMIRDQVLTVGTSSKPVVIGSGGSLTTVASAYLLALRDGRGDEFARKVIVAPAIGVVGLTPIGLEYNASQDEWAFYVVLARLRVVMAPIDFSMTPADQQRIWDFIASAPSTPMGAHLRAIRARYPYDPMSGAVVGDMQPIMAMLHPQEGVYFHRSERVAFDSWSTWPSYFPDHGPWDPARPDQPALNWNALKAIVHVRSDAGSSALLLQDYDLHLVANQFLTTLQSATAPGLSAPTNLRRVQ
jgi:hypothetical protein